MIRRYTLPEMEKVWQDETRFLKFLEIELLVCEALAKLGKLPKNALNKIKKKARFDIRRINKLEEKTKHDVVAFITNLSEYLGPEAKYLHLGVTSSDLLDTTLALQCKEATDILIKDLKRLIQVLRQKAIKYKDTVCIGRTHGVHAEPITFGLKLAVWFAETKRNLERLILTKEAISVGKISGAVGSYTHIEPFVEKYVCKKLGLKPANISTQIIQRDIHAQYLATLAIIAASLEKFATEIRHLQRTEVLEVEEPFSKGQKGSSAMPHKRNPIICERICGLARLLRSNALCSLENISLWHERDISHSSAERIIFPDSTILLDYMLNKFIQVLEGLVIYPDNMLANIIKTKGLIFSEGVLLKLMEKGIARMKAYEVVQRNALVTWERKIDFKNALMQDSQIKKNLTPKELEGCFQLDYYLKNIKGIFKRLGLE